MANAPLTYRRLRKILSKFGVEESTRRGKGSHRMFVRIHDGRTYKYPMAYHGEKTLQAPSVVKALRRALQLTEDDGVSDREFFS